MGEPVPTMPWADDVSRALRSASECRTGSRRDRADALLDQGPCGFDGIEVVRVGWQKSQRGSRLFDQGTDRRRFMSREVVQHNDVATPQLPHQVPTHHATKRTVFMAPHVVASVSQRSTRIAPTRVRLSPQLMGRSSMSTVPRGSHACDRPIARFAPDSSTKTRRRGSIRRIHRRNLARSAWTVARSCSAGRARFFEDVSRPLQRPQDTGPMHASLGRHLAVVRARQFVGRLVGFLLGQVGVIATGRSVSASRPPSPKAPASPSLARAGPSARAWRG
jgi:hypothetical protein